MRILLPLLFLSAFRFVRAEEPAPRTFEVTPAQYQSERAALKHPSTPWETKAAEGLRRAAELKMKAGPWTVMTKTDKQAGPSGDKHDYVSLSEYFWKKPDGTWEWRDGQRNPDVVTPDEKSMEDLLSALKILANAGYLLGDDHYLARAAYLIRYWFLDPATRMNPNLNFAAGIPGQTTGRGVGLHRLKDFPLIVDALGLIATSQAWTPDDQKGMIAWVKDYMNWAETSPLGKAEREATNNHSVYYGGHMLACALYVDDKALIDKYSTKFFQENLIQQVEPDGSMPAEMARTRPYNYGVYAMVGFCYYAELARNLGIDYYSFKGKKGQTLQKAFDWYIPFLKGDVKSPKKEEDMREDRVFVMMRLATLRYGNPFFENYMEKQFPDWMSDYRNLLWPPPKPSKAP